ncbi:dihydrofolate reductase [Microbacterium phage Avocadoman]|uniref:dihydrofolate reductase n=1 Tax=Microbacterium phage Avocadoman TaxID=2776864 RepID=UPI0018A364C4|nr:dihydrofolate reductase [Microbacterium phage Avocadoman]QOP64883.1 dihydrofolate reductase [Microbacterium phage Avocadoman]
MTTDTVAVWAEATRAYDRQPVMGKSDSPNGLPWGHSAEDLAHFREVTRDRVMVMGRRTFELLPAVLKSRRSLEERPIIVLTREKNRIIDDHPGLDIQPIAWATDQAHADVLLNEARNWFGPHSREVAIIGGRRVIELFAPIVDRLEVTFFHDHYDGDILAPSLSTFDTFHGANSRVGKSADFFTFTKERHS